MSRKIFRIAASCVAVCWASAAFAGSPGIDGEWSQIALTGPTPPPGLSQTALAYDSQRHRALYFAPFVGQTWSLDLDGTPIWSQLSTQGTPPGPQLCAAFYHEPSDRLIVIGDNASDVWALTLDATPTWSPISTPNRPVGGNTSFAYDAVLGRVFEYGGVYDFGTAFRNELFAFTVGSGTWATLSTPIEPVGRAVANMIYDPTRDRVVIEGGIKPRTQGGNEVTGETWAFSIPALDWSPLPVGPAIGILGTFSTSATIYDPGRDRMIVFDPEEIWALSFEPPVAWTQLAPLGNDPGYRGMGAIYDPVVDRMVLYGGDGGSETWQLQWDPSTPTQAALVSSDVTPDRIQLVWQVSAGAEVTVEGSSGGEWSPRALVTANGIGRVSYEDVFVVPAHRYGYRLRWQEQAGQVVAGEVWIDVPSTSGLQLLGVKPNPSAGPMEVGFALPSAGDVSLEVFDVRGRRIGEPQRMWLPGGSHVAPIASGVALPAGVYLVRLTFGGTTLWTRAISMR